MEPAAGNASVTSMTSSSFRKSMGIIGRTLLMLVLLALLLDGLTGPGMAAPIENSEASSGRPLVVAIQYDQTYTMKDKEGNWTGPMVDFWRLVARELKRPYTFKEMSLSNIITALERGTIDVAAVTAFINAHRENRFDFSTPLGEGRHAVVTVYQAKHEHPWMAAISVFFSWGTLTALLILLALLFLLGILIWFIERKDNAEDFGQTRRRGIGAGVYWAGSTLASGLCFGIYLKTVPGRILGLTWMIVCGLALSAVIASLTHSVTDQLQQMQMIEDDEFRYMHLGVKSGSVQVDILKEAGAYYTLFDTDEDAMNGVLNGQTDGYLCLETRANFYANHDYSGKISVYPTRLKTHLYALAMPKGSALRKPINVAVLKLLNDSVWESLLDQYGLESVASGADHQWSQKPRGQ
jgi:polar amino acid transport system substrate-binding protein